MTSTHSQVRVNVNEIPNSVFLVELRRFSEIRTNPSRKWRRLQAIKHAQSMSSTKDLPVIYQSKNLKGILA